MPELGTLQDFLALWPLWLVIAAIGIFVFLTRGSKIRDRANPLDQQMQDQRRVNSIFNIGAMFGRRD